MAAVYILVLFVLFGRVRFLIAVTGSVAISGSTNLFIPVPVEMLV
jgi:hypothetical protein